MRMEEDELFRDNLYEESKVPDKWDYFEIMDRSSMLLVQLEAAYLNHPGLDAAHARKAQVAFDILNDLYQYAGQHALDDKDSSPR